MKMNVSRLDRRAEHAVESQASDVEDKLASCLKIIIDP